MALLQNYVTCPSNEGSFLNEGVTPLFNSEFWTLESIPFGNVKDAVVLVNNNDLLGNVSAGVQLPRLIVHEQNYFFSLHLVIVI